MAANTLPDQISSEAIETKHNYLDLDRVEFSTRVMDLQPLPLYTKYPDFFKVGIAESGTTRTENYEDDWGERYNGLEEMFKAGTSNYESNKQTFAKDLKGKLMLIHGGWTITFLPQYTKGRPIKK
jgi:hypothetical protein